MLHLEPSFLRALIIQSALACTFSLLAAGNVSADPPRRILHRPPSAAEIGQSLPMSVILEPGAGGRPAAEVVLFYRPLGAREYTETLLFETTAGQYTGTIPGTFTESLALSYYLEIAGTKEQWRLGLGSATQPIVIDLLEPASSRTPEIAGKLALTSGPLLLVAVMLWYRERRARRAVLDQVFWLKMLAPLARLHGGELSSEIAKLTQQPHMHPLQGRARYPRSFLWKKLAEVRRIQLGQLQQESERYLHDEKLDEVKSELAALSETQLAELKPSTAGARSDDDREDASNRLDEGDGESPLEVAPKDDAADEHETTVASADAERGEAKKEANKEPRPRAKKNRRRGAAKSRRANPAKAARAASKAPTEAGDDHPAPRGFALLSRQLRWGEGSNADDDEMVEQVDAPGDDEANGDVAETLDASEEGVAADTVGEVDAPSDDDIETEQVGASADDQREAAQADEAGADEADEADEADADEAEPETEVTDEAGADRAEADDAEEGDRRAEEAEAEETEPVFLDLRFGPELVDDDAEVAALRDSARQAVWERMDSAGVIRFPYPAQGRLPNFAGADDAATALIEHPALAAASSVFIEMAPPLRPLRKLALQRGLTVLVWDAGKKVLIRQNPHDIPQGKRAEAATAKHFRRYGDVVEPSECDTPDVVCIASVVVSRGGQHVGLERHDTSELGRLLTDWGAPIATVVHDLQLVEEVPSDRLQLSLIATPSGVISTACEAKA